MREVSREQTQPTPGHTLSHPALLSSCLADWLQTSPLLARAQGQERANLRQARLKEGQIEGEWPPGSWGGSSLTPAFPPFAWWTTLEERPGTNRILTARAGQGTRTNPSLGDFLLQFQVTWSSLALMKVYRQTNVRPVVLPTGPWLCHDDGKRSPAASVTVHPPIKWSVLLPPQTRQMMVPWSWWLGNLIGTIQLWLNHI
jgi:hypothetical protein